MTGAGLETGDHESQATYGHSPHNRRAHVPARVLIVGTGKYPSPEVMIAAHDASGAEMVTVAVPARAVARPSD